MAGPRSAGPLLTVTSPVIGTVRTTVASGPPTIIDLPTGVDLQFEFWGNADHYGGIVVGWRFGWDILDLNDPDQWEVDFTPFIGGGFGFANVEYDIDSVAGIDVDSSKEDDNVMAYQIMLGGSFAATEQLSIDLQYRFFGTENPEIDGTDIEYQSHNAMLGLRYSF